MYKYLLDHPSFSGMKLVVLTDPVPSTNYHNGNNNMPSIVWLREQKTHTIHLIVCLLIPLYLSIQAIPTGFLWESYQTPSRSNGCLIASGKISLRMLVKKQLSFMRKKCRYSVFLDIFGCFVCRERVCLHLHSHYFLHRSHSHVTFSTCFSLETGSILKPQQLSVHGLWIE